MRVHHLSIGMDAEKKTIQKMQLCILESQSCKTAVFQMHLRYWDIVRNGQIRVSCCLVSIHDQQHLLHMVPLNMQPFLSTSVNRLGFYLDILIPAVEFPEASLQKLSPDVFCCFPFINGNSPHSHSKHKLYCGQPVVRMRTSFSSQNNDAVEFFILLFITLIMDIFLFKKLLFALEGSIY